VYNQFVFIFTLHFTAPFIDSPCTEMSEETLVFIREAGQEEFDILYISGTPDIDAFHNLVKESLGVNEEIIKVTMDGIAIRNANGIKFMLKKQEPKVEVTFAGTGVYTQIIHHRNQRCDARRVVLAIASGGATKKHK